MYRGFHEKVPTATFALGSVSNNPIYSAPSKKGVTMNMMMLMLVKRLVHTIKGSSRFAIF